MGTYDDVLFAGEETSATESVSPEFNPEEYQEQKQQERDFVYGMIDKATLNLVDPNKLKEYLDIQARFNLYRPGNVLLIQAQLTEAALVRSLVLGYEPKEKPDDRFYDVMRQLSAIGNSMNQIARKANALGFIDAWEYEHQAKLLQQFQLEDRRYFILPSRVK